MELVFVSAGFQLHRDLIKAVAVIVAQFFFPMVPGVEIPGDIYFAARLGLHLEDDVLAFARHFGDRRFLHGGSFFHSGRFFRGRSLSSGRSLFRGGRFFDNGSFGCLVTTASGLFRAVL